MDTSRVSVGEMIAAVSALALFVLMFLPWFGADSVLGFGVGDAGFGRTAWEAFSLIDVLLFLVCVVVLALVLASAAAETPDLPRPPATVILWAGAIAVVLILFRLLFPPSLDSTLDVEVEMGREVGAFLGLLAAAGIAYGGWRATDESAEAR